MAYQVNNYKHDWNSKNYECCDNCSNSNNNVCNNQITPKAVAATQLTMFFTNLVFNAVENLDNALIKKSEAQKTGATQNCIFDQNLALDYSNTEVQETSTEEVNEQPEENKQPKTDSEIKQDIQNLLSSKQKITDLDDTILNELVAKYKDIKANDSTLSDDLIALKLANHVNCKIYAKKIGIWDKEISKLTQTAMDKNLDLKVVTTALRENQDDFGVIDLEQDGEISKEKLNAVSCSYFEFNDENDNAEIDLIEYFKSDLVKYYQTIGLNFDDAKTKAKEKLVELGIKEPKDLIELSKNIDFQSDNISDELLVLAESVLRFDKLDQKEDCVLDIQEIQAYHAAMANFDTADNKLGASDYNAFNQAVLFDEERIIAGKQVKAADYFLKGYYGSLTRAN